MAIRKGFMEVNDYYLDSEKNPERSHDCGSFKNILLEEFMEVSIIKMVFWDPSRMTPNPDRTRESGDVLLR
jgi:hypothetical protein